jgi:c-di-GMP-binding flagellar brake protein YcgR
MTGAKILMNMLSIHARQPAQADKPDTPERTLQDPGGLSLDQTKLRIGDSMQLQFQTGTEKSRFLVNLIGYVAGQSVIVSMPVINGRPMLLREGQNLNARFFSGKSAYAFSSVVRKADTTPYPYLHLSYPPEVRELVVRSSPRAQAHIACHASTEDGSSYKCIARDISVGGALIACREEMGKVGEGLLLRLPVRIDGNEHTLDLNCQIRSVNTSYASENEMPVNLFGLAFQEKKR